MTRSDNIEKEDNDKRKETITRDNNNKDYTTRDNYNNDDNIENTMTRDKCELHYRRTMTETRRKTTLHQWKEERSGTTRTMTFTTTQRNNKDKRLVQKL